MSTLNSMDESEWLTLFKSGDWRSYEYIFRRFQPALLFFANQLTYQHEVVDPEEIVQDSFMKLIDRRGSFETLRGIKSFLYITTKNRCLQVIETEKVRLKRFEKYMGGFEEQEEAIISEIIYTEVIAELHTAIDSLPLQCRTIMKKFMDGKTAHEISAEMGITVSTVNSQRFRAVSLLKHKLSFRAFSLLLILI